MKKYLKILGGIFLLFAIKTYIDVEPVADSLRAVISNAENIRVVDRNGKPLTISYQNRWNNYDVLPLHKIPQFLQDSFITSEDKRFYQHGGVDWKARAGAVYQNLNGGNTRGASTITEQVVRMITPRPRNLWSKWIEGIEAFELERKYSKNDILEFYLNQLPYASNRRGVAQAARYYFNRDLGTLTKKEMLALVVLARAPSGYDLYKNPEKIEPLIKNLAKKLGAEIGDTKLTLQKPELPVNASHFISFVRKQPSFGKEVIIRSSIDSTLQNSVQNILDERVKTLAPKNLHNAAALVVDNQTHQIIAWVVSAEDKKTTEIDAVTTPRQPGSSMKPFLYTTALEKGWTAATIIEDAPLSEAVGAGLHSFNNYSHVFYGNITLREALGNSLNIPALKTINFVGVDDYLKKLHELGFANLNREAEIYNEGLALGNGEVSLYEIVRAYSSLANHGEYQDLSYLMINGRYEKPRQVFSEAATSLIGNILSDPWARRLEFGSSSVLNLPVQTAAKTGTSTDYRDTWAIGYNYRYTVGIWMGNLNREPTNGITGSTGPALVLRSIFSELNKNQTTKPLYLSKQLQAKDICIDYLDGTPCFKKTEYFMPNTDYISPKSEEKKEEILKITRPSEGLNIAYDPRIPPEKQAFKFYISGIKDGAKISWYLDDAQIAETAEPFYLWQIARGKHQLHAIIINGDESTVLDKVSFVVK